MSGTSSFIRDLEELNLLRQHGCPRDCFDGVSELLNCLPKCLIVKTQFSPTFSASDDFGIIQSSDLFKRYMAAFRARDWPQVRIIEHEIRS